MYIPRLLSGFIGAIALLIASGCSESPVATSAISVVDAATGQECLKGSQIAAYNASTQELVLDKKATAAWPDNGQLIVKIDNKPAFTIRGIVEPWSSASVHSMVLFRDADNKLYLHDCYPNNDELNSSPEVLQAKTDRAAGWALFLDALSHEHRLK